MKKKRVPIFNESIYIYNKDEADKFSRDYDCKIGKNVDGMSCGNGIWIGNPTINVMSHEASHYVDWFMEDHLMVKTANLWDNTEVRAYLLGFVAQAVFDYVTSGNA